MMNKIKKILSKKLLIITVILFSFAGIAVAYGEDEYGIIENFDLYRENYETGQLETVNGIYYGSIAELKSVSHSGEFTFDVGDSYSGEWDNKTIEGWGTYSYETLGSYTGYFENNLRSGEGTFKWSDGGEYVGYWELDRLSGTGTYTAPENYVLKGTFSGNKFIAGTVKTTIDDTAYTYYLEDGTFINAIDIDYSNGSNYHGDYKDGKINGTGIMNYSNGDQYSGQFGSGLRAVIGTYTWKNGATYSGDWSNDKMNGKGVYTYPTNAAGKSVSGNFVNNNITGSSTYIDDDGKKFEVIWSNGVCKQVKGATND